MVGVEATIMSERKTNVAYSLSFVEISPESSDKRVLFRIPVELSKLVRSYRERRSAFQGGKIKCSDTK